MRSSLVDPHTWNAELAEDYPQDVFERELRIYHVGGAQLREIAREYGRYQRGLAGSGLTGERGKAARFVQQAPLQGCQAFAMGPA
jgi:hypothetical protein